MQIKCDDELYRVNRTYLGPKGKPFPLRATYRAWGLAAGLLFGAVVVWRMIGLPWHAVLLFVFAAAAYGGAKVLDRHLTVDRPVTGEVIRIFQELAAPRPELTVREVTHSHQLRTKRWRAGARPESRWWVRAGTWLVSLPGRTVGAIGGRRDGRVYVEGEWQSVR